MNEPRELRDTQSASESEQHRTDPQQHFYMDDVGAGNYDANELRPPQPRLRKLKKQSPKPAQQQKSPWGTVLILVAVGIVLGMIAKAVLDRSAGDVPVAGVGPNGVTPATLGAPRVVNPANIPPVWETMPARQGAPQPDETRPPTHLQRLVN